MRICIGRHWDEFDEGPDGAREAPFFRNCSSCGLEVDLCGECLMRIFLCPRCFSDQRAVGKDAARAAARRRERRREQARRRRRLARPDTGAAPEIPYRDLFTGIGA